MTHTLELDDDTAARLRALAVAAAPAVAAPPTLAVAVLRRAGSIGRRRRAIALAGGGVIIIAAVAAATLPGGGAYFTVIQPSENMAPTVEVGDAVVLGKELIPTRGDVVQTHLTQGGDEFNAILRVVGMPGDTVECPAEVDGTCAGVLVNGSVQPESYLAEPTEPFQTQTVPEAHVFLLGDHRVLAVDSRQTGPTDLDSIVGVAVRINRNGESLAVPGAPVRPAPGGSDGVDPADEVPPAEESSP